jgi:hypothetical protein
MYANRGDGTANIVNVPLWHALASQLGISQTGDPKQDASTPATSLNPYMALLALPPNAVLDTQTCDFVHNTNPVARCQVYVLPETDSQYLTELLDLNRIPTGIHTPIWYAKPKVSYTATNLSTAPCTVSSPCQAHITYQLIPGNLYTTDQLHFVTSFDTQTVESLAYATANQAHTQPICAWGHCLSAQQQVVYDFRFPWSKNMVVQTYNVAQFTKLLGSLPIVTNSLVAKPYGYTINQTQANEVLGQPLGADPATSPTFASLLALDTSHSLDANTPQPRYWVLPQNYHNQSLGVPVFALSIPKNMASPASFIHWTARITGYLWQLDYTTYNQTQGQDTTHSVLVAKPVSTAPHKLQIYVPNPGTPWSIESWLLQSQSFLDHEWVATPLPQAHANPVAMDNILAIGQAEQAIQAWSKTLSVPTTALLPNDVFGIQNTATTRILIDGVPLLHTSVVPFDTGLQTSLYGEGLGGYLVWLSLGYYGAMIQSILQKTSPFCYSPTGNGHFLPGCDDGSPLWSYSRTAQKTPWPLLLPSQVVLDGTFSGPFTGIGGDLWRQQINNPDALNADTNSLHNSFGMTGLSGLYRTITPTNSTYAITPETLAILKQATPLEAAYQLSFLLSIVKNWPSTISRTRLQMDIPVGSNIHITVDTDSLGLFWAFLSTGSCSSRHLIQGYLSQLGVWSLFTPQIQAEVLNQWSPYGFGENGSILFVHSLGDALFNYLHSFVLNSQVIAINHQYTDQIVDYLPNINPTQDGFFVSACSVIGGINSVLLPIQPNYDTLETHNFCPGLFWDNGLGNLCLPVPNPEQTDPMDKAWHHHNIWTNFQSSTPWMVPASVSPDFVINQGMVGTAPSLYASYMPTRAAEWPRFMYVPPYNESTNTWFGLLQAILHKNIAEQGDLTIDQTSRLANLWLGGTHQSSYHTLDGTTPYHAYTWSSNATQDPNNYNAAGQYIGNIPGPNDGPNNPSQQGLPIFYYSNTTKGTSIYELLDIYKTIHQEDFNTHIY